MAYRELELTLVSAQDLKNVNLITRMDVYAVVSISGDPLTRQCTEPDAYGGRNPCWNETFRFAVPPTAAAAAAAGASLHVLLRAERFLGDRDVGEVVVPLADILAGATGPGPQQPHVASYQVRKLHRWEPRGVLNVSYRLGPVVAPVVVDNKPAVSVYAPVCVPPQPSHPHPSPVTYQEPPEPAPGRPAVRVAVAAEHDEAAAQNKSPVMAYPVVVPQQPSPRPPAKPADAYRQLPPPSSPRPAAVHHATGHEEARAPTPPPAPPTAPRTTNARNNNGLGQPGTTHVYVGPQTQIFFGSGGPTTTAGPPTTWTTTTSPARSTISPAGKKGDGNWALPPHDTYASAAAAESVSMSVVSPRSRKEDHRWRPSGPSPSKQQAASSPVAAPSHHLAASPFSSRSSSSSPLSPYSAHPSPSSSAHSSNRSPYSSLPHPSTATSPHPPLRSPAVSGAAEVTHGTNNGFRSTSSRPPAVGGAAEVSHGTNNGFRSTSSSRGGGAAISSPLPLSSPMVTNHSSVVH